MMDFKGTRQVVLNTKLTLSVVFVGEADGIAVGGVVQGGLHGLER